jgi:hypothetical protein
MHTVLDIELEPEPPGVGEAQHRDFVPLQRQLPGKEAGPEVHGLSGVVMVDQQYLHRIAAG